MPTSARLAASPAVGAYALPSDDQAVTYGAPKGALGKRLERLRRERGLTLARFADVVGVSKPTVWAWESGKCRPRTHRVAAIAMALGVDPEELTDAALAKDSADDVRAVNIGGANVIEECRQRIAASFGTKASLVRIIIEV